MSSTTFYRLLEEAEKQAVLHQSPVNKKWEVGQKNDQKRLICRTPKPLPNSLPWESTTTTSPIPLMGLMGVVVVGGVGLLPATWE
jgi:hypothetical protein